ncbi:hypothetical protein CK203_039776 [Vitis vinifera]|uniref:Uncharacterized protein n=1 Tax=Vitis vinifera TaxID=29760 RepID=A0A438HTN9_VITVI|nr:hypothetical protein CK203_039776 [Vitis vinifera]
MLEALFRISEEYFFGPHHLIMVALLYFEEKVHQKKLLRADAIPLLFPKLLCQILEHLGYPADPQLEHKHFCREIFTLDKWTSMTAYGGADQGAPAGAEQPEEPVEPPAPTVALSEPPPEERILATQAQHTTILRQIQHHLGITSAPEHAIPSSPEPSVPQHHPPTI